MRYRTAAVAALAAIAVTLPLAGLAMADRSEGPTPGEWMTDQYGTDTHDSMHQWMTDQYGTDTHDSMHQWMTEQSSMLGRSTGF